MSSEDEVAGALDTSTGALDASAGALETSTDQNGADSAISGAIGRLSLTKSDGTVRYFNIRRSIQIGRGAECDIRIKVKTVSRVHCKVRREAGGTYVLENASNTNFTVVNRTEVPGQIVLRDGDVLTVAERDFTFQLVEPPVIPPAALAAAAGGESAGAIVTPGAITMGLEDEGAAPPVSSDTERVVEESPAPTAVMPQDDANSSWYSVLCSVAPSKEAVDGKDRGGCVVM